MPPFSDYRCHGLPEDLLIRMESVDEQVRSSQTCAYAPSDHTMQCVRTSREYVWILLFLIDLHQGVEHVSLHLTVQPITTLVSDI